MKKRMVSLLCILLSTAALVGCGVFDDGNNKPAKPAKIEAIKAEDLTKDLKSNLSMDVDIASYEPIHKFSYELIQQNLEEENPVLSPISAYLALALAGNGAREETLEEFRDVLGDDLTIYPYGIMQSLERSEDEMVISLANSIWVDERMEAKDTFLSAADSYFDAEVYRRELSSQEAMTDMNTWVNAKTKGMIPSMITEPLDKDTCMVLFNTLYFNGKWKSPFKGYDTRELEFHTQENGTVTTPMMQKHATQLLYVKNDFSEGVVLPYKDEELVFLALKPTSEITVREMYAQLSWEDIGEFLEQEETTLCNLRLPKFKVSFEKELNRSLKDMGLMKAFDGSLADLTGLGTVPGGGNLFIGLVKQKAMIVLDEEGTEASAATMVEVKKESAVEYEKQPVNLYFDEPFLYMIIDGNNDIPLFMGIMDNPVSR